MNGAKDSPMGKNEKPSVKAELDKYRDDVRKEQRGAAPEEIIRQSKCTEAYSEKKPVKER